MRLVLDDLDVHSTCHIRIVTVCEETVNIPWELNHVHCRTVLRSDQTKEEAEEETSEEHSRSASHTILVVTRGGEWAVGGAGA